MNPNETYEPGLGATEDLDLRVSVATLVRVVFEHPRHGDWMLALERRATLHPTENGPRIDVKSQPFGGAVQIRDLTAMHNSIGDFHFDSDRSRAERDLRIFIRSSTWKIVREFCLQHLRQTNDPILETDPVRELAEEFEDVLQVRVKPEQYRYRSLATILEDSPSPTENMYANGVPTVRIYRIFEARINDVSLAKIMLEHSQQLSNQDVHDQATRNGSGMFNAALVLPLEQLTAAYTALLPQDRNHPIPFGEYRLDETVTTVLDDVLAAKYQRV